MFVEGYLLKCQNTLGLRLGRASELRAIDQHSNYAWNFGLLLQQRKLWGWTWGTRHWEIGEHGWECECAAQTPRRVSLKVDRSRSPSDRASEMRDLIDSGTFRRLRWRAPTLPCDHPPEREGSSAEYRSWPGRDTGSRAGSWWLCPERSGRRQSWSAALRRGPWSRAGRQRCNSRGRVTLQSPLCEKII